MILYHGSNQIIKTPELRSSTRTLDFGTGFYTTTNKEQAVNFAIKVYTRSIREGSAPRGKFISVYEAEDTIAILKVRQLFDQMTFGAERSLSFLKYSDFIEVPND
jgi:hypothetical protein